MTKLKRLSFQITLVAIIIAKPLLAADDFFQTDIFVSGKEGYHTYRIPALITTPKGTLLAFCEGRRFSRADLGNNDLLLRRSTDGGQTWTKTQLVYEEGGDEKQVTIANPTAVIDEETGVIWLVMQRNGLDVLISHSKDDGKTWAKAIDITTQVKKPEWGFYAVGPGVGIQIKYGKHKGRLVIPAYHRETKDKSGPSASHMFYSDDHGKTWKLGADLDLHTNECQVVETMVDGQSELLFNARNHWARSGGRPDLAGVRIIARSKDGGETWSKASFDKTLIEPQCQASLVRHSWPEAGGKSRILFANPASRGRNQVTVRLSYDEGKTWPASRLVYKDSSAYTSVAALADGRIGLLYERDNYGKITFASFTVGWLTDGKDKVTAVKPNVKRRLVVSESDEGILVMENGREVLFYQRKPKSLDGKYERANYIHPLYDLDGNVLTEDFPKDHPHHRGIFWAWHQLWVGDKKIGDGWACKDFSWEVQHTEFDLDKAKAATLKAKVIWKSPAWTNEAGDQKPLVEENTTICVHVSDGDTRKVDFDISLLALEKDLRIGGSENDKGYGGFSTRVRLPDDTRFVGRSGELQPMRTAVEGGPWLDMQATFGKTGETSGIAILCHPSSPGFPQPWILRRRSSMQNPAYPGQHPVALSQSKPLELRYRLVLHQNRVENSVLEKWAADYAQE